ncbi:hypothetical protein PG995_011793 [Apiospora arundinis]
MPIIISRDTGSLVSELKLVIVSVACFTTIIPSVTTPSTTRGWFAGTAPSPLSFDIQGGQSHVVAAAAAATAAATAAAVVLLPDLYGSSSQPDVSVPGNGVASRSRPARRRK